MKPLVIANWKMNKTVDEARAFVQAFLPAAQEAAGVEVVLCPSFVALEAVAHALKGAGVETGAQNAHPEPAGTFTGEVSVPMLQGLARYVLVGHSERRTHFGEDNALVHRKVRAVLGGGLSPVVCVGETRQERETGRAEEVVAGQVGAALEGVGAEALARVCVAYEPLWAISAGAHDTRTRVCRPEDAARMHAFVRGLLGEGGERVRILYGGSVREDTVAAFLRQPDIDGVLVGGASLDPARFAALVNAAARAARGA